VKEVQIAGGERKEMIIIQMYSWERKEEIMRRKKKLGSRKIYIDNDLTQEEREVQKIEGGSKRRESEQKKNKSRI